jgi:hypothetical protein
VRFLLQLSLKTNLACYLDDGRTIGERENKKKLASSRIFGGAPMPNQLLRTTSSRCLSVASFMIRASLFAVCSLFIAVRSGPANGSVTTFTDSAAYFAVAGAQTLQDFNSPISNTATSIRYPDLLVSCSGTAFCDAVSFGTRSLPPFHRRAERFQIQVPRR